MSSLLVRQGPVVDFFAWTTAVRDLPSREGGAPGSRDCPGAFPRPEPFLDRIGSSRAFGLTSRSGVGALAQLLGDLLLSRPPPRV